jgi:nicotinamide phosphoribosyltransferase
MSERQYVLNMIEQFAKPGAIFAMVADSYNIYNFCEMLGDDLEIKEKIDAHRLTGGFTVIRPDSGDPVEVLPKMFKILGEKFGFTKNEKGYKVLNSVRVIWGDGIDSSSLSTILRTVVDVGGWSADNIAFGMGGGLLQQCNRDTLEFAMKASAVGVREWVEDGDLGSGWKLVFRDVFKDPITASNKASKKGKVKLWTNNAGEFYTSVNEPTGWTDKGVYGGWQDAMETYFLDGAVMFTQTFEEVRNNTRS